MIRQISDELTAQLNPKEILLFGSYAKGGENVHSDVDLLVVTDAPVPPSQQELFCQFFHDYPVRVDLLFRTVAEVTSEGRQKHSFLNTILNACIRISDGVDYHHAPRGA